jgi:hypothetical protein
LWCRCLVYGPFGGQAIQLVNPHLIVTYQQKCFTDIRAKPLKCWWSRQGSNLQPNRYERDLAAKLRKLFLHDGAGGSHP